MDNILTIRMLCVRNCLISTNETAFFPVEETSLERLTQTNDKIALSITVISLTILNKTIYI